MSRHIFTFFFFFSILKLSGQNNIEESFGSKGRINVQQGAYLWHPDAANTAEKKSGNISIIGASRYGIRHDLELSTSLGADYFVPNLALKKLWTKNNFYVSTRHTLFSATPGLQTAQRQGWDKIVGSNIEIVLLFSMTNELILSKAFVDRFSCAGTNPWLILSGSAFVSFGMPIEKYESKEMQYHFLANRGEALAGRGVIGGVTFRADYQRNANLVLRGGVRYFAGTFSGHHAVELHGGFEYFPLSRLSIAGAAMISMAGYDKLNFLGAMPIVDLTWYFGRHEPLQTGLFEKQVYKVSSRKEKKRFIFF